MPRRQVGHLRGRVSEGMLSDGLEQPQKTTLKRYHMANKYTVLLLATAPYPALKIKLWHTLKLTSTPPCSSGRVAVWALTCK